METPYEYHNGKLCFKIRYLISDKHPNPKSLKLISYRSLKHRMDSSTCNEIQLRKPSTGNPVLIEFGSLDRSWQQKIEIAFGPAPANIRKSYFSTQYEFDVKAYQFFSRYTEGIERRMLTDEKVNEYTFNASVLNTVGKVKENRKAYRKLMNSTCTNIWDVISVEVNSFSEVPHTLPISPDGLRKKYAKYEKHGFSCLVDGRRNNDNARKVDSSVVNLLNALFAGQDFKPTAADVARSYDSFLNGYVQVLNKATGELYNPADFKKLSHSTISSYLSDWENTIATHQIRGGNRQINIGKFTPHHEMDLPTLAGALLSIDDRQPPFYYEPGKRAWFYLGLDVASGCFTAFVYAKTKEDLIIEFYRQLVRNYTSWGLNMPYELECESSLNSSFRNTFLREGAMFQKVRIEANNARGKYIERMFGKVRYEVEKSALGWVARPHAKSEKNQIGNQQLPLIPYDQLIESRLKELEDWNNSPHPTDPSMTRFDYFMDLQSNDLPDTNWRSILPHIGYHTPSSCNVGYVILQGRKRMIAENGNILFGEALIAKMKRIEGKKLDIYWLDSNDGSVLKAVAFQGEEYICELMPIPRYNRAQLEQTDQDLANREIQAKYVATVEAFAKLQKQSVDKVLVIDHQQKTLNRRFQITGLTRFAARTTEVEELPDHEAIEEYNFHQNSGTGTAKSFKDNYKI